MKKIIAVLIFIFSAITSMAQTPTVIQNLYKFSPLGEIIVRNLGMEDKNANGVIDKGANEGYEGFIKKYGTGDTLEKKEKSIDSGFYANYVIYGAGNARLEENEIVIYYYLNIRFKYPEETAIIDKEIKTYVYANNLPLVWLDDEKGTVIEAVTKVLGGGWNEKQVTEDEAVNMLNRALNGINIIGRTGDPANYGGYYTLQELIKNKKGYCTEVAQFGFWFFSELRINSIITWTVLTSSILHDVIKLNSGRMVDYFGSSYRYNISKDKWYTVNPLQTIGTYYLARGHMLIDKTMLEQSVLYDKYRIDNIVGLMNFYFYSAKSDNKNVIGLGNFFINNNDIDKLLKVKILNSSFIKEQLKDILTMLMRSCYYEKNKTIYDKAVALLKKHYDKDNDIYQYLKIYRL